MTLIDRTQFQRQAGIVDMIRALPPIVCWHAISEMPVEEQNDLYDRLRSVEVSKCEICGDDLDEDDIELCFACGNRSERLANMQELCNTSGVVFGERL